jgi:signal transduction histidine kinase
MAMASGIPSLDREHGILAGVCAGLARHFGVRPRVVRVITIALTVAGGLGVALYVLAYVAMTTTADRPEAVATTVVLQEAAASWREGLGAALIAGAAAGALFGWPVAVPFAAGAGSLMVLWRSGLTRTRRGLIGSALVAGGAVSMATALPALGQLRSFAVAMIVVLAGSALLFGPWWLRMAQALTAERTARIRAQERAEVAAHLHDSVLQTLALIQRRSDDPAEVAQLARRQERDLRAWLNQDATAAADTLHGALVRTAAEVEAHHGIEIEVVCVGDRALDDDTTALVAAAREAMVNAAKFAGAGLIDVYAEASDERAEVFVRDRGAGFDPGTVPADRRGVRESIVGRMARHGGRAEVRSAPGQGTEVELVLP